MLSIFLLFKLCKCNAQTDSLTFVCTYDTAQNYNTNTPLKQKIFLVVIEARKIVLNYLLKATLTPWINRARKFRIANRKKRPEPPMRPQKRQFHHKLQSKTAAHALVDAEIQLQKNNQ